MKRVLCVALAIMMLMSALGVAAFADNGGKCLARYNHYTVLGDSIATGYGMKAYEENLSKNHPGRLIWDEELIDGSYAQLVGSAVGANKVSMCAHSGWRVIEYLQILDPGFSANDRYYKYYKDSFFYRALDFLEKDELEGSGAKVISAIKSGDLISLNIGANDIFSYALTITFNEYSYIVDNADIDDVQGLDGLLSAFIQLLTLATEEQRGEILTEYATVLKYAIDKFETYFPVLIDEINNAKKPNADLLVIGLCNPININYPLDLAAYGIDLYTLTDAVADQVNYFLRTTCCNADTYNYVDVIGTPYYGIKVFDPGSLFSGDMLGVKVSAVKMIHPDENGHAYMADKIIGVLNTMPHFADVDKSSVYCKAIVYCFEKGYMQGITGTQFAPDRTLTRAQLATVLYRMSGAPDVRRLSEPFVDVGDSYWARDAIVWAYNTGIVKGVSSDSFMPDANVSRGQAVTMLYRMAGSPPTIAKLGFADAGQIPQEYKTAVAWANGNNVVRGYPDNCFRSSLPISRAQTAMIISNYTQR